jgi:serine protease Do
MAQPIMKSLMDHGKVVRGWLGVSIQDVDQQLATAMKLKEVKGILISDVAGNGPALKAGLKSGDVVLKLNGAPVESTGSFRNAIAAAGSGTTVKLELLREGKPLTVDAKLGELPADEAGAGPGGGSGGAAHGALDGLTLGDLTPDLRRKLQVPPSVKGGVVVEDIDEGSRAASSGLRPGDVVVEVGQQPVTDVAKFKELYSRAKGSVLLRVIREGRSFFVATQR